MNYRLLKADRDRIVNIAIANLKKNQEREMAEEQDALWQEVSDLIDKEQPNLRPAFAKLARGGHEISASRSDIAVKAYNKSGDWQHVIIRHSSKTHMWTNSYGSYVVWGDLGERLIAYRAKYYVMADSNHEKWKKLSAFVGQFKTRESLLAGWPEGRDYINEALAAHASNRKPSLPAVMSSEINAMLGLPKEGADVDA